MEIAGHNFIDIGVHTQAGVRYTESVLITEVSSYSHSM